MATRSIVTSQPDVACDVCERRLLRGEHSDVFLVAGQRRTVCELCAPRALHAGWLREADRDSVEVPRPRPRRRRGLFGRLRQPGGSPGDAPDEAGAAPAPALESDELRGGSVRLDGESRAMPVSAGRLRGEPLTGGEKEIVHDHGAVLADGDAAAGRGGRGERAIEAFNVSEHPRRVAGLARSLGAPRVGVRPDEDVEHLVSIVVAWELCWYRYEVDVDDPDPDVRLIAQGTELDELASEDRLVNAVADELGALSLSAD